MALNDLANPKELADLKFERNSHIQNFIMFLSKIKIGNKENVNNSKMLLLNYQMVLFKCRSIKTICNFKHTQKNCRKL